MFREAYTSILVGEPVLAPGCPSYDQLQDLYIAEVRIRYFMCLIEPFI